MCGRYRLSRRKQIVEEYFDSAEWQDDWSPRYNIAPTQTVPVDTAASKGTSPADFVADAVGTDSVMVERPVRRGENDQRQIGDGTHPACIP